MIEHGMSTAEAFIVDMLRRKSGEFARGVIGSPFHALCDRLQGVAPQGVKVVQGALLHALKEAGWVDCGRIAAHGYPNKKHIFRAPDVDLSKSELRRLVENT
jgi:class 3 adenylate cyclase